MWKSATNAQFKPNQKNQQEEDDWETDPDFVNQASEKEQRWGEGKNDAAPVNLHNLKSQVVESNQVQSKTQWESQNGQSVKKSYGVKP